MASDDARWLQTLLRRTGLAVVLVAALVVLARGDREVVRPVVVAVALLTSWGMGRLMRAAGLPPVLGWLTTGVVLGPAVSALVRDVFPGWPFAGGMLGTDTLGNHTGAPTVSLAIAMVWTGAQLDLVGLGRKRRAVAGLILGHVVAIALVAGGVGWALLEGPLAGLHDGLVRDPDDVAGFAVTLLGASALLAASVVHEARSEGPVGRAILWVAVVSELLAITALAVWTTEASAWTGLLVEDPGNATRLVFTAMVGIASGVLMAGVGRWVPQARGPWVVSVALVAGLAATQAGLSAGLVGLTAGITLRQLAPGQTSMALHLASGLAMLVVFTAAGAQLPLDALLAYLPLGGLLALLRAGLLVAVAWAVARFTRSSPLIVRYGWTGLLASGIPVAGLIPWRELDPTLAGHGATSLVWSLAAVDGVMGALAMHVAIAFARETPEAQAADALAAERKAVPESWDDVSALPEGSLRDHTESLAEDLDHIVRDLRHDELRGFTEQTITYLDELRMEFRRHHRKVGAVLQAEATDRTLALRLVREEFVDRWRSHVFDHAARMNRHPWRPTELVDRLDRLSQGSPTSIPAPPVELGGTAWHQAFQAFTGWLVGAAPRDSAPWRELLRYHLSGRGPSHLEPVAAVIINAELHLAARTRELFHRVLDAYDGLDERPYDAALLERIAEDVADDLRSARDEVDAAIDDASRRLTVAFGALLRDLCDDLMLIGSFDLPVRQRSLARVTHEREAGLARLTDAYDASREAARVRFAALTLEIELVGLELEVEGALGQHGSQLARLVRGRGTTQLERVEEALNTGLEHVEALLGTEQTGRALAEGLREEALLVSRVATDAAHSADELREQLASDEALAPLLDALVRAGNTLTDRYEVPLGVPVVGSWSLPGACRTIEVPFREVVLAYIETSITRDLHKLTHRYATELEQAISTIEDVDRVVGFNAELAAAELMSAGDQALTPKQRDAVREIVLDGVERNRGALRDALAISQTWFEEVDARVQKAVMDDLDDLRVRIADGTFGEIVAERPSVTGERRVPASGDVADHLHTLLRGWVGETGLAQARERLGLAEEDPEAQGVTPARFAPPVPKVTIPMVYRRLFSDQALQAGELLGGREAQADRVRSALADHKGARLRTVVVLGPDGVGQPAIVRAALRALRVRGVHRFDLRHLVDAEEVAGWFDRGTHGHVYVVTGFHWLYQAAPGGFAALRAFVDGVVADEGRNAWLVEADDLAWSFASAAAPLERTFPTVVRIDALGEAELRDAMLARHGMSGFELQFAEVTDPRRRARYERAWFKDFHVSTGGIARDAMQLWLAAIDEVDTARKRVVMGPAPKVATAAMRLLSDRSALALRVAARQGWIDEITFARLFRETHLDARAHLAHLVHWGLLQPDGDRYVLPEHLKRALRVHFAERGWA